MILHGDSLELLKTLDADSVDAVVTDPPYGLSFMGKKWDYDVPSVALWAEVFRVLKPGGHLVSFGGTRTYHRLACAIEDAGFDVRDQIQWIYGSGFPKSLDVSKAIDKASGAENERPIIGKNPAYRPNEYDWVGGAGGKTPMRPEHKTGPATADAKRWQGWGTALKPANEPIVLARKPLSESTVAKNVLRWGTGALNIDGTRIAGGGQKGEGGRLKAATGSESLFNAGKHNAVDDAQGRWPSNVLLGCDCEYLLDKLFLLSLEEKREFLGRQRDTLQRCNVAIAEMDHLPTCAVKMLDEQSIVGGIHSAGKARTKMVKSHYEATSYDMSSTRQMNRFDDSTIGASRFFYVAKASKRERNAGLEGMPERVLATSNHGQEEPISGRLGANPLARQKPVANHHPTVKPIKLMEYLCKLICPPGGVVLDPFMGSGSTGVAARRLGFRFIGIERESEYVEIARRRIEHAGAEDASA